MNICFEVHKNQKEKSGCPYVFYPFHFAEQMDDEYSTIVALLHDVVEDSDMTRMEIFTQRDLQRRERNQKALVMLIDD